MTVGNIKKEEIKGSVIAPRMAKVSDYNYNWLKYNWTAT